MSMKKKTKTYYPMSLAFYPERACVKLAELAAKGWRLKKVGALGGCFLEKGPPATLKYALDFYTGAPSEVADYLEFFEESGWHLVTTYKKRYQFFSAATETPEIFSDEATYLTRIKKEWLWLLRRSLLFVPAGLVLLGAWLALNHFVTFPSGTNFAELVSGFITGFFILYPVALICCIAFYSLRYRRRKKYYNQPEKLVGKQHVAQDMVAMIGIGFCVGLLLGLIIG